MDKYDLTTADQDIAVQTILTDLCEIFGQEAVYISLGGTYGMDHHTGDEHHSSPDVVIYVRMEKDALHCKLTKLRESKKYYRLTFQDPDWIEEHEKEWTKFEWYMEFNGTQNQDKIMHIAFWYDYQDPYEIPETGLKTVKSTLATSRENYPWTSLTDLLIQLVNRSKRLGHRTRDLLDIWNIRTQLIKMEKGLPRNKLNG